jgi:hypothetical protein
MRFKLLLFQGVVAIVSLLSVKYFINGFTFSTAPSYLFMFWTLYIAGTVLAVKVRTFFLLPQVYYLDAAVTAIVIAGVFWVCSNIIGGVTFHPTTVQAFSFLGISVKATAFGTFGTIGLVAVLSGALYQVIILLEREK